MRHGFGPRSDARDAAGITLVAAMLSCLGTAPAPGLPALLERIEMLTGWPMLGLAWAVAVGAFVAWAARLSVGLQGRSKVVIARVKLLGALVAPALLPGASVLGLCPALLLALASADRSGEGVDRRVALMLAAAMVGTLADPRVAPAGAVALIAAARHLLKALDRGPANDNTPPPFAWRASGLA